MLKEIESIIEDIPKDFLSLIEENKSSFLRIKIKEYILACLLKIHIEEALHKNVTWRFANIQEDIKKGIDIYLKIDPYRELPVDLTTNPHKQSQTKKLETVICYIPQNISEYLEKNVLIGTDEGIEDIDIQIKCFLKLRKITLEKSIFFIRLNQVCILDDLFIKNPKKNRKPRGDPLSKWSQQKRYPYKRSKSDDFDTTDFFDDTDRHIRAE